MSTTKSKQEETKKADAEATKETAAAPEPVMEAIEEDDEFEEFEPCNWGTSGEDAEDAQQWKVSPEDVIENNVQNSFTLFQNYLTRCL